MTSRTALVSPTGADKGAVAGIQHILAVQASSPSNTRVQQIQIHIHVSVKYKYTCPTFFFYLHSAQLHAVTTSASGRFAELLVYKVLMWLFEQYGPIVSSLTENFPFNVDIIFQGMGHLQFWYSRCFPSSLQSEECVMTKWVDDSPDDDDVTAKRIEWTGRVGTLATARDSQICLGELQR